MKTLESTTDVRGGCSVQRFVSGHGRKYKTIVADPPWRVNNPNGWGKNGKSSGHKHLPYATMTFNEILALPVGDLAADVCHLYLWTTNKWVERSYAVARAWGFNPATLLTWCKPMHGLGPGGHYVQTTEFCLFARRSVEGRNPAIRCETTWWEWPRRKHSEKPEQFLDIAQMVSDAPRIELFARTNRLGWDSWGNECRNDVELVTANDKGERRRESAAPQNSKPTISKSGSPSARPLWLANTCNNKYEN